MKIPIQRNPSPGRDLKPGPLESDAGLLSTQPRHTFPYIVRNINIMLAIVHCLAYVSCNCVSETRYISIFRSVRRGEGHTPQLGSLADPAIKTKSI
jgi:hypothetical protein